MTVEHFVSFLFAGGLGGLIVADGPSAANAFATKTDIAAALSEVDANLNTHDEDVGAHTAAIGLHSASPDPHGDRAYAVSQVAAHQSANDPHGDRLYASAAIAGHNGDPNAHEAINSRFDLSGSATVAVAAHAAAIDPHGDRAFADAQIAAHNQDVAAHFMSQGIIDGLNNPQNPPTDYNPFMTQADVIERTAFDMVAHSAARPIKKFEAVLINPSSPRCSRPSPGTIRGRPFARTTMTMWSSSRRSAAVRPSTPCDVWRWRCRPATETSS